MKAFLINPHNQTITEVEHNGDYRQIYELIGAEMFDVARLNRLGDGIYVDDEGLFNHNELFEVTGYCQPLAGRGLVLGCNAEGESTSPSEHVTLEWLEANTKFFVAFAGMLLEVA